MSMREMLADIGSLAASQKELVLDVTRSRNVRVVASLLGPAFRGFVARTARGHERSALPARGDACFDWTYRRDHDELARLYAAGKSSQWDADQALDWTIEVDLDHPERVLIPEDRLPLTLLPGWQALPASQRADQTRSYMAWALSQFLHGEQGAFYAAAQVAQAVPWLDGKLFGGSQVADEARHVEVFHRYLTAKLGKLYRIDENLYVIVDAIMRDPRADLKFLGMQIMIEGLALGAFALWRATTEEPLLRELLKRVITDEARHVRYGVLSLREQVAQLSAAERREREDWAFELSVLMRNRFLFREFHEEYWAHKVTRRGWEQWVLQTPTMAEFRRTMFRRIVPNLRSIGLLSERIRPRYAQVGLLEYENGPDATRLGPADLLDAAPVRMRGG